MELETVHDYNQHYLDNYPPTPCPHCPHLFSLPHTMAKHKYSHVEVMFKCETCGQGFTFKSQYKSHHRVHLKIQGFVCFKANCGQRFKRESELNAHLKAHTSKPIKCDYCDYKTWINEMYGLICMYTVTNYHTTAVCVGSALSGRSRKNDTFQNAWEIDMLELSGITISTVL